jgi:hypothetical protein
VTANNLSNVFLVHTLAVLRRQFVGPVLFGLLSGGVPFGIVLFHLGPAAGWGDHFFAPLTPVAVFVAAMGAITIGNDNAARLLARAFLTSISACIPIPLLVWTVLAWRGGFEILDIRNLPFAATLFVLWALGATLFGWLLALALVFLKNRYSRSARV